MQVVFLWVIEQLAQNVFDAAIRVAAGDGCSIKATPVRCQMNAGALRIMVTKVHFMIIAVS
jgi:hypothetical protein